MRSCLYVLHRWYWMLQLPGNLLVHVIKNVIPKYPSPPPHTWCHSSYTGQIKVESLRNCFIRQRRLPNIHLHNYMTHEWAARQRVYNSVKFETGKIDSVSCQKQLVESLLHTYGYFWSVLTPHVNVSPSSLPCPTPTLPPPPFPLLPPPPLPLSLPQVEDFLHPEGKVSLFREETPVRTDSSLLSSLYFYWVSNDQSGKALTPSEIRARKTALKCIKVQCNVQYMWQSRVEIEHHSVAYFDRITAFEALKHRTSSKGGAQTRWVNLWILTTLHSAYEPHP